MTALARTPPRLTPEEAYTEDLRRDGYVILRGAADPALVAQLHAELRPRLDRTPMCDGDFYGRSTKRFGGLLKRARHAEAFVMHPLVTAITDNILSPYCDRWQLNLTQAIEIHPGQIEQAPHRDQDMWNGELGKTEYLVNVMWPFTRYTRENGATLVWPGSHRDDPETFVPGAVPDWNDAIAAEMEPGDALLFLGSTLHGGGANRSLAPRTGMIISYCLGWLKPYENQWLTYPPEIARLFSPELAGMVGYRQHRPNLGNVDGRDPSELLSGMADYQPATEALTEAQRAALAGYVAAMKGRDLT